MKRIVNAALVSILARTVFAASQPQPAVPILKGTVRVVDPKTGSLELVTGVGMALRLVRLHAVTTTRIVRGNTGIALTELRRGDIVRAECHRTDKGLVADRIEKVAIR